MSGSTESFALAPANERDHEEIVALANRAYRGKGGWNAESGIIEGERTTIAHLRADLADHPRARLFVHRDPQTARLLSCLRLEPQAGGSWRLALFAVDPDCQAQGLGRRALSATEDMVRRLGGNRIEMSVINLRETLIAWYERRGYRRTGETEPFPYGDERLGRPLRDDMEFVTLAKRLD